MQQRQFKNRFFGGSTSFPSLDVCLSLAVMAMEATEQLYLVSADTLKDASEATAVDLFCLCSAVEIYF